MNQKNKQSRLSIEFSIDDDGYLLTATNERYILKASAGGSYSQVASFSTLQELPDILLRLVLASSDARSLKELAKMARHITRQIKALQGQNFITQLFER